MTSANPSGSAYTLQRKVGELERGEWWLAFDRTRDRMVLCARMLLDGPEQAALVAELDRAATWPGSQPADAIEVSVDGPTLVAYTMTGDDHEHPEPSWYPLSATDAAFVEERVKATLAHAHANGTMHPGLAPEAIAITRTSDGALAVLVRGLGLPALPGRDEDDDRFDLARCLEALTAERVSAPIQKPEGSRPRGMASRVGTRTDHGMQNAMKRVPTSPIPSVNMH